MQRKEVLEQLKLHRKKFASLDTKRNSDMYTIIEKKEPEIKAKLGSPKKATQDWGALPARNTDPMNDSAYVRRLKKANYGKWYMDPGDYNRKADFITQ